MSLVDEFADATPIEKFALATNEQVSVLIDRVNALEAWIEKEKALKKLAPKPSMYIHKFDVPRTMSFSEMESKVKAVLDKYVSGKEWINTLCNISLNKYCDDITLLIVIVSHMNSWLDDQDADPLVLKSALESIGWHTHAHTPPRIMYEHIRQYGNSSASITWFHDKNCTWVVDDV